MGVGVEVRVGEELRPVEVSLILLRQRVEVYSNNITARLPSPETRCLVGREQ